MLLILTAFFQISVPQFHREYRPECSRHLTRKAESAKTLAEMRIERNMTFVIFDPVNHRRQSPLVPAAPAAV
jgi:hypothetical protein